jgi:ABC-type phosphate/phosphonate transport system substrate-binding protein
VSRLYKLFVGIACLAVSLAAFAQEEPAAPAGSGELTLMVEPSYAPARLAEVFEPLASYLGKAIGRPVKLVTPRNYHFFWRDIRQNTPVDLMYAEAHFTDYRAQRHGAVPLARTSEKLSYSILASDLIESPDVGSLVGKRLVTMPSPSMGFALLTQLYPNPVSQPEILSAGISWRDGVEMVFADEAEAAIVPTWLEDEYPNLVPVWQSREFMGPAISASPDLDPELRERIREALLSIHEDPDANEVLLELRISRFEPATAAEYDGADRMLREFHGFQPR